MSSHFLLLNIKHVAINCNDIINSLLQIVSLFVFDLDVFVTYL